MNLYVLNPESWSIDGSSDGSCGWRVVSQLIILIPVPTHSYFGIYCTHWLYDVVFYMPVFFVLLHSTALLILCSLLSFVPEYLKTRGKASSPQVLFLIQLIITRSWIFSFRSVLNVDLVFRFLIHSTFFLWTLYEAGIGSFSEFGRSRYFFGIFFNYIKVYRNLIWGFLLDILWA